MEKTKWIEIISVRLSDPKNRDRVLEVLEHILAGKCPLTGKEIDAELYVDHSLDQDLAIHLSRNETHGPPGKTVLGSSISEMFGTLGLVNHKVWQAV